MSFEVGEPIQNRPFDQPERYWYIGEGEQPELTKGTPVRGSVSATRPEVTVGFGRPDSAPLT